MQWRFVCLLKGVASVQQAITLALVNWWCVCVWWGRMGKNVGKEAHTEVLMVQIMLQMLIASFCIHSVFVLSANWNGVHEQTQTRTHLFPVFPQLVLLSPVCVCWQHGESRAKFPCSRCFSCLQWKWCWWWIIYSTKLLPALRDHDELTNPFAYQLIHCSSSLLCWDNWASWINSISINCTEGFYTVCFTQHVTIADEWHWYQIKCCCKQEQEFNWYCRGSRESPKC